MDERILIGIGSTEAQMLAVAVLSYTLHKHTKRPLEIVPLWNCGIEVPQARDPANRGGTPFSFQRFLLPELAGPERRSIYLDSDMIVFSDIGGLYDTPMNGNDVLACERMPKKKMLYSVLLLGAGCPWRIDDIVGRMDRSEISYHQLMYEFRVPGRVSVGLSRHWNSLEVYEPGTTHLLHYTDMWTQPWLVKKNKLAPIWIQALCEAIDAGFATRDLLAECVERRWVRPSLLYQVEKRIHDPRDIPWRVQLRDIPFERYCRREKYRIF